VRKKNNFDMFNFSHCVGNRRMMVMVSGVDLMEDFMSDLVACY
jgi:hypothetical protein